MGVNVQIATPVLTSAHPFCQSRPAQTLCTKLADPQLSRCRFRLADCMSRKMTAGQMRLHTAKTG